MKRLTGIVSLLYMFSLEEAVKSVFPTHKLWHIIGQLCNNICFSNVMTSVKAPQEVVWSTRDFNHLCRSSLSLCTLPRTSSCVLDSAKAASACQGAAPCFAAAPLRYKYSWTSAWSFCKAED